MKSVTWLIIAGFVMALSVFSLGCDSGDSSVHEATVTWSIGGFPTCVASAGAAHGDIILNIETVQITVYRSEQAYESGTAEPVLSGLSTPCSVYEYAIQDLKRGNYYVVLEGMVNFEGETWPFFIGGAPLVVPSEDTVEVALTRNSGSLEVGWGFEGGNCANNWINVQNVTATVTPIAGAPISSGLVPCTDSQYLFSGLDWGDYTLVVDGFDPAGVRTYHGEYVALAGTDTGPSPDAGVATGTDTGASETNLIKILPGKHIAGRDAYIVLREVDE